MRELTKISVAVFGLAVLTVVLGGCGGSPGAPTSQSAVGARGATATTAPSAVPSSAVTMARLSLSDWGALYCGALDTLADRPFTPAAMEEIIRNNDAARFGRQLRLFADTALELADLFEETVPPDEASSYHQFITEFLRATGLIWRAAAQDLQSGETPMFRQVMDEAGADVQLAAGRAATDLQSRDIVDAAVAAACPSRFALEAGVIDQWTLTFCEPVNGIAELLLLIESDQTPLVDVPALVGQIERLALDLDELDAVDEETQVFSLEFADIYGSVANSYRSLLASADRAGTRPTSERAGILRQAEVQFNAELERLEERRLVAITDASSALLASLVRGGCFQ